MEKAYQRMEETFPKKTVQGWFICGAPGCMLSPLTYWRLHKQYFGGKNQLMYINSGVDGEAAYYVMSEDGFYRLKGYHIYYEKNQMMQDYMILRKDARRVETGTGDRVIRDFRNRMEERQQEAASRYGTIRALGSCAACFRSRCLPAAWCFSAITRKCARWRVCWYPSSRMVCGALRTGKRRSRWNSSAAV